MKRRVSLIFVVVVALIACFAGAVFSPSRSLARSVVPIEGSNFDISLSLIDNLKNYMGKNVFIHLKSGKTLQGNVKAIGNNLVHLEKLNGKDFYDALINIEEINAIEAKFRDLK